MKRFFKNLVILILVLGAVGGTAWFFYSQLTKERDCYAATLNYQESGWNKEFIAGVNLMNQKSGANRFGLLCNANAELEKIHTLLIPYLSKAENSKVDSNKICSELEKLMDIQVELTDMVDEYIYKADKSQTFNKSTGGNPVYKEFADYISKYAKYLKVVNSEIGKIVNQNNDSKFYVIEIYLSIVENTFANVDVNSEVYVISNELNILKADLILPLIGNYNMNFSANSTAFVKSYQKCGKKTLVENFSALWDNSYETSDTNLKTVVSSLKGMVG